jgi:acyl-CoA synthetase (AMP-forming)/AMP-acid ligase II
VLVDILDAEQQLAAAATSSLRATLAGGGSVPVSKLEHYEDLIGGIVSTGYGRTEGAAAWNPLDRASRRLESNGRPLAHATEIRVTDEAGVVAPPDGLGEIAVRGKATARGYWRRPDLTERLFDDQGWMRTGDVGRFDADGFLYFVGRLDHGVKTGGENVNPGEVETILMEHPSVRDVAVVGVPDERLGEAVTALVVPAAVGFDAAAVLDWCRSRMAGFKRPRRIVVVDQIDRLVTRKVDYRRARQVARERLQQDAGDADETPGPLAAWP